jgi:hypothetical protein
MNELVFKIENPSHYKGYTDPVQPYLLLGSNGEETSIHCILMGPVGKDIEDLFDEWIISRIGPCPKRIKFNNNHAACKQNDKEIAAWYKSKSALDLNDFIRELGWPKVHYTSLQTEETHMR